MQHPWRPAAKQNAKAVLDEPRPFRVWSEHLCEADARCVLAITVRGALLMAVAWEDDDGALAPRELKAGEEHGEDWLVRDPVGRAFRFRIGWRGPDAFMVVSLRACRMCGARTTKRQLARCPTCRTMNPDVRLLRQSRGAA